MTALGLALGLPFQGSLGGGDLTPQNVQATAGDKQTTLTWNADDNLGYAVYFSRTNNFAGAQLYSAYVPAATVSYDVAANVNTDPSLSSNHAVGTFYYYWVCGTDGAGNVVTDPSTVVSARPYITLADGTNATLYAPDEASFALGGLLFGNTQPSPVGTVVNMGGTDWYALGDGNWEDDSGNPGNSEPVTSPFIVTNLSGSGPSSYTFWNTEP